MTTICTQCGAVLPAKAGYCRFCNSSFSTEFTAETECVSKRDGRGELPLDQSMDSVWRAELSRRLTAYRTRRRRLAPHEAQTELPFAKLPAAQQCTTGVSVAEPAPPATVPHDEEFAFTIAIGRQAKPACDPFDESRMEIDVSVPPEAESTRDEAVTPPPVRSSISPLFPVTSLARRRIAALIDAACLLFAYGGFLTLFGSLGGQFTLNKLGAAVYVATLTLFYLQYFALFTVFGGTTPGMMLRNLHLVSFTGEPPRPRQLLLRSLGYVLSAGSFFLGFAWAYWDEDQLTWHDRLSRTYLTSGVNFSHAETCGTVPRA